MVSIGPGAVCGEGMGSVVASPSATTPLERAGSAEAVIIAPKETCVIAGLLARPILPQVGHPRTARAVDRDQGCAGKSEPHARVIVDPDVAWKIESRSGGRDDSTSTLPITHLQSSYPVPRP